MPRLIDDAHQGAGGVDDAVACLHAVGGALVQREGGGPVGDGMLGDGGGFKVAQVPALGPQVQKIPQELVFIPVGLGLADGLLHLGDGLFQRGIFLFQSGDVFIIGLLVVEPGGNGGVGRAEGRGQHAGDIGQGRG